MRREIPGVHGSSGIRGDARSAVYELSALPGGEDLATETSAPGGANSVPDRGAVAAKSTGDGPRLAVYRDEALAVGCPLCGAEIGQACIRDEGSARVRRALHIERHAHAIDLGARPRFRGGRWIYYADEHSAA